MLSCAAKENQCSGDGEASMSASFLTDPVPPDLADGGTTVWSLNMLVVRCRDLEASVRFYTAIGLRFQRAQICHMIGGGADITVAKAVVPGPDFALMADEEGAKVPCLWLELQPAGQRLPTAGLVLGLFVASADAAVKAGVFAGGALLTPAADWPYGRRAALADPDGNRVELSESPVGRITGDYPE
jgi:lactoylglutathione lyase